MDIEFLSNVSDKLEKNLRLVEESLEFANVLTKEDLVSTDGKGEASPIVNPKKALTAYFVFEKDQNKLKAFMSEVLEYAAKYRRMKVMGDYDVISSLLSPLENSHLPILQPFDFHTDTNRVSKEIDVQITVICEMLSVNPPQRHQKSGQHPSSEAWERQDLYEAMNIVKAARSIAG